MYMTFNEVMAEQKKPLDYKIGKAVEAITEGFRVGKHTAALAFSGGKDSTVLWHLIRSHFPEQAERLHIIYGNTGVEYPESLQFARDLGSAWGGDRFHETRPLPLERDGLKYEAQCEVLRYLTEQGRLPHRYRVLTPEESMEIELRLLREMAERYGAQIERARRDLVYRCDLCGAGFDRPVSRRWSEARPDGFREPFCQAVCPWCGAEEQYVEEVREDGWDADL